jgi:hypothetical protein
LSVGSQDQTVDLQRSARALGDSFVDAGDACFVVELTAGIEPQILLGHPAEPAPRR